MNGEDGPPGPREQTLPLRLALEEAADAIDRAVTALLEPGVADAAAAAGTSPLLGVDCMWWSQQLRAAARKLEQAADRVDGSDGSSTEATGRRRK